MQVALFTTFAASKKEPLAALFERVRGAFHAAGEGEPTIRFNLSDAPVAGFVSSVDRVLKRYPEMERFVSVSVGSPVGAVRQITNGRISRAAGEAVDPGMLLEIASGVPRSFPFHNVQFWFRGPSFGPAEPDIVVRGMAPGVMIGDSWWISGRTRSVSALVAVEVDPARKALPPLPGPVAAVIAACGKAKSTVQLPLASPKATAAPAAIAGPSPEVAQAIGAVVQDYRARLAEIVERAGLPHDLPPALESMKVTPLGTATGPKKPVLVRAFKPLGYECRGETGMLTLRRRTAQNLTVEISLDVGTWSRSLTGHFTVQGLGFGAMLPLPVSKRAIGGGQYPIGDAARWQQIVDNLAALVAELDRSFVPAVEAASGPAPGWYQPEV